MSERPIVVLTPVKNEEWILDRFLRVTTRFADLVIVADQDSTDASRAICERFEKVHVIRNPSAEYNEDARQLLLLEEARRLVPGPKILLALDADEILAADAPGTEDWQAMLRAGPGTVLLFDKPALYPDTAHCLPSRTDFPGGFVDDGAPHRPRAIHSYRLPTPDGAPRLALPGIRFLHYSHLRPRARRARFRMYAVIENVRGTKGLYARRRYYRRDDDARLAHAKLRPAEPRWFEAWESLGIDMRTVIDEESPWQDQASRELLIRHGARRFWLDDIWDVEWNGHGDGSAIRYPPRILRAASDVVFRALFALADMTRSARARLRPGAGL